MSPPKPEPPALTDRQILEVKILCRDVVASPKVRGVVRDVLSRLPDEVLQKVFVAQRTIIVSEDRQDFLGICVQLTPPASCLIVIQQLWSEGQMGVVVPHELAHAFHGHAPTDAQTTAEAEVEARCTVHKWGFDDVSAIPRLMKTIP